MPRSATTCCPVLILLHALACGGGTSQTPDGGSDLDGSPSTTTVAEIAQSYVDPSGSPGKAVGMVIGIATPEGRLLTGIGATTIGGDATPTADSLFDLASVTKVYTGYLLAKGVLNQEVHAGQELEETFGSAVPTFEMQSITLMDLATHTSALPDYPDNMVGSPPTPAADYTRQLLEEFLGSYELKRAPGEQYTYSNLGSGTLGEVLVDAANVPSFDALVQREIAIPYGLDDTTAAPSEQQAERKVQGYDSMILPAPALDIGEPLQGGGILKGSADDVLSFLEGAIGGNDPAWLEVIKPRRSSPNGVNGMTGLLLNIEQPANEAPVYSKGGGAPGFSSMIMFTMDPPIAVVILSNVYGIQGKLRELSLKLIDQAPLIDGL